MNAKNNRKINIFFDFDMTLGYRIMMWRDTVRELLLAEGIISDYEEIRCFTDGRGYPWNFPQLTHEEFLQGKDWWENTEDFIIEGLLSITNLEVAQRVSSKFRTKYIDLRYWGLFPHTISLLKSLEAKGYNLYILSNHVPEARQIITQLGIAQYFTKMFISSEIGYEKPNPEIYRIALNIASAEDMNIMIGDNIEADIKGSLDNGFTNAILVRKPNSTNYPNYSKLLDGVEEILEKII